MTTLNTVTKQDLVNAMYNATIQLKAEMSEWAYRQNVLMFMRKEVGASAPTMFNKAKKAAITEGTVEAYGRAVNPKLGKREPATPEQVAQMQELLAQAVRIAKGEETVELNFKWLVIEKATNKAVTGADSKNKAYKIKDGNPDLVVRKAA